MEEDAEKEEAEEGGDRDKSDVGGGDDEDDEEADTSPCSVACGSGYRASHSLLIAALSSQMPASPSTMNGATRFDIDQCDGASADITAPTAEQARKWPLPRMVKAE